MHARTPLGNGIHLAIEYVGAAAPGDITMAARGLGAVAIVNHSAMRMALALIGIATTTLVFTACGSPGTNASSGPDGAPTGARLAIPADAGHVHGIARSRTGTLLVGTHGGLFTTDGTSQLRRVGDADDVMGLAALPAGGLLSSGHPGAGSTEPNPLGLRLSQDDGVSWTTITRVPRDDYHVIEATAGRVYAVGSDGAIYVGPSPATLVWAAQAPVGLIDLAARPGRPRALVAATQAGLRRSDDGGRRWSRAGDEVGLLSWAPGALFLVDAEGTVSVSMDAGESWSRRGTIGAPPAAILASSPSSLVAADHEGRILMSSDGGRSWS